MANDSWWSIDAWLMYNSWLMIDTWWIICVFPLVNEPGFVEHPSFIQLVPGYLAWRGLFTRVYSTHSEDICHISILIDDPFISVYPGFYQENCYVSSISMRCCWLFSLVMSQPSRMNNNHCQARWVLWISLHSYIFCTGIWFSIIVNQY